MKKSEVNTNKAGKKSESILRPILPRGIEDSAPKCFVCDKKIIGRGAALTSAATPYYKIPYPNKIGMLLGNDFMVIVSAEDMICIHCINLFNLLDRLEMETEQVKIELTNYLKQKYQITDQLHPIPQQLQKLDLNSQDISLAIGLENIKNNFKNQKPEQELSNMFGSPVKLNPVNPSVKRKRPTPKLYKCLSCDFQTANVLEFKPHSIICKKNIQKNAYNACNKTFTDEHTYKTHIAAKLCSTKRFRCENCNFIAANRQKLLEHEKTHPIKHLFKCGICSQRFKSKNILNIHVKKHRAAYFKCGICSEMFQERGVLMEHLSIHNKRKKNEEQGPETKITSESTQSLLQASIEEALQDSETDQKSKSESKEIKFFTCNSCQLTFINESNYAQHMKTHENINTQNGNSIREENVSSNSIDLESIFEKIHSDVKQSENNVTLNDNDNLRNMSDITLQNIFEDVQADNMKNLVQQNQNIETQNSDVISSIVDQSNNKTYIYKCNACNEIFSDSSHLQIHLLTTSHGQIDSQIQILEISGDTQNMCNDNSSVIKFIQTEENGEIKLIPVNNEIKDIDDMNLLKTHNTLNSESDSSQTIQFFQTEENGEIKFIPVSTHDGIQEVQLMSEENGGIKFISLDPKIGSDNITLIQNDNNDIVKLMSVSSGNEQIITSASNNHNMLMSNGMVTTNTADILQNSEVSELLQSVVSEDAQQHNTFSNHVLNERTKIQIIDDKKIDLSNVIEHSKEDEINLEELCDMAMKGQNHQVRMIL